MKLLYRGEHQVRQTMSCSPEMFSNWESSVVMAGLDDTVPVSDKPDLTRLATLTTVLGVTRAGPVPFGAGDEVQGTCGGAVNFPLDGQALTCVTNCNRLLNLSWSQIGVGT